MSDSKFDFCSRALTRVGASVITSFDEGTAEAIVAGQNYESQVRAALTMPGGSPYRWRFATMQKALVRLGTDPTGRWSYAFQLPGDMLALHAVTRNDRAILYDRYGDALYTDEDADLVADYAFRPAEALWPPYFTEALECELGSLFALSLVRDKELADALSAKANWPGARAADSQQQTTRRIAPSRLVAVRR